MKTDPYIKTILTIIAICLTINAVQQLDIIPSVYATEENKHATLDLAPFTEIIDVRIVDINTYDELNVNIKSVDTYDELKVNIKSIDTSDELDVNIKSIDTSDELDVNIDEIGGIWVKSGGPIPVTIRQQ